MLVGTRQSRLSEPVLLVGTSESRALRPPNLTLIRKIIKSTQYTRVLHYISDKYKKYSVENSRTINSIGEFMSHTIHTSTNDEHRHLG